ncbi:MAG: hypothetical protein JAY90_01210 [Candidatus Thiodiazotropha lotti]|nr:hypothetical protein [Candidatus Thiodiazotropha lotti]
MRSKLKSSAQAGRRITLPRSIPQPTLPPTARPMVDNLYKNSAPLLNNISDLAKQAETKSNPESDNVTVVALRWRASEAKLTPADFSMSLARKNRGILDHPEESVDVSQAIQDLRKMVDDLDEE